MKHEEILVMSAGRELDALVAEKVMHWYITEGEYSGKKYWNDENDYSPYSVADFKPSTDISAAWEIVEKLRPTHIYELADFGRNTHKTKQHYAWFHSINRGSRAPNEYQMRASSLTEAVCKAALIAVSEGGR